MLHSAWSYYALRLNLVFRLCRYVSKKARTCAQISVYLVADTKVRQRVKSDLKALEVVETGQQFILPSLFKAMYETVACFLLIRVAVSTHYHGPLSLCADFTSA